MNPGRLLAMRVLGALAAIALTAYLAFIAWAVFPSQATADFYQFWGVGAVREAESIRAVPYTDRVPYDAALLRLSAASPSEKLRAANEMRPALDPTGTPFFYALFAALPRDYEVAQAIFLFLVYASGYGAVFALCRLRGFGMAASASIAAGAGLSFGPLIIDVRVGNVNSLQLACIAGFLAAASRRDASARAEKVAIGLLGAFVVFKPNTALVAAALGARHLIMRSPTRGALIAAFGTAIAGIVAGAWYFADAGAWTEWAAYARRLAGVDPSIAFESGNQSLAMWLARRLHSQVPGMFGLALGTALVVAVVAAAAGPTRDARVAAQTLRRVFADPFFAVSFAILLTFAASPLVWIHYLVLALVPMIWLVRGHGAWAAAGAIAAYAAMASPVIGLIIELGGRSLIEPVTLLSWLALVPGLLTFVSRSAMVANPSSSPPKQESPPHLVR